MKTKEIDLKKIKPYGDTLDDGKIQFSFTLPVPRGDEAKECAKRYLELLGFENVMITHMDSMGKGFSFFVAYAASTKTIDYTSIIVPKANKEIWDKHTIVEKIEKELGRKIIVVGACIESDAHTVGIDAILNMKGIAGHKGLESYHGIEVYNLGAQVPSEEVVAFANKIKADVILISQIVTQKDVHIANMTKFIEILEAEKLRSKVLAIAGGPRITHELALELGFDAGFGVGTFPEDVATFILQMLLKKKNEKRI